MNPYTSDFYRRICDASMQLEKNMFKPDTLYLGFFEQAEFIRLLESEFPMRVANDGLDSEVNRFNEKAKVQLQEMYMGFKIKYVGVECFFGYSGIKRYPKEAQPSSETSAIPKYKP